MNEPRHGAESANRGHRQPASAPRSRERSGALDRPAAVTVVSVLQLVFVPLGMIVVHGTSTGLIIASLEGVGLSPEIEFATLFATWVLALVSALGMLSGARWAWWAGAFFYANAMARAASALLHLAVLAQRSALDQQQLVYNAIWVAVRIPIFLPIYVLFFTDGFLAYFERGTERKLPTALALAFAAFAIEAPKLHLLISAWMKGP